MILTLQNPQEVHLLTEGTQCGVPELILKDGDFAFQAPAAWAVTKAAQSNCETFKRKHHNF